MIDSLGKVPGFNARLAKSPASLATFHALASALAEGVLTLRERELIGVAVAHHGGCPYAFWTRSQVARSSGLTGEDLAFACAGTALDPREAAILAFTARYLREGRAPEPGWEPSLCDADRVEIVANTAYQMLATYIVQAIAPGRKPRSGRTRSAAGFKRRGAG